jgi:hypothetical protein
VSFGWRAPLDAATGWLIFQDAGMLPAAMIGNVATL